MAHVAVVSAAYWGDVMPYVPIARELVARGHRVTLAVPRGFHEVLRDDGFDLVHLGTDFSPRELAEHGHVLDRADSPLGMRAATELWVQQLSIDPADRILEVLHGIGPDVWLSHPSIHWLVESAAAGSGTPIVVGHLFPMMIPSPEQPLPMLPVGGGRALNRIGWRMVTRMAGRMMYDEDINRIRAEHGLEPARGNVGFGWERADRTLLLTSEHYWPRPADWPENLVHTGLCVWTGGDAELPDDLDAHLDAGSPPVVVTFGTSAATNAKDAFAQVAAAIEAVGERPLLLVGNERNRDALADRDDVWTFAPLPAVLARSRAIVHAGGQGSTAAALSAGTPQLAMPMGVDQMGHARRIRELGVGTSLAFRRRSPARLAAALAEVLGADTRAAAADFAALVADEDGPATAADRLEAVLAEATGQSSG